MLAVQTGLEPAVSTLTGWRGLQLPYRTMIMQLPHLDSNQDPPVNSRALLPLSYGGTTKDLLWAARAGVLVAAIVAETGFEPACAWVMSPAG